MKICLITSQLSAWGKIGGIGVNARRLGKALAEKGLEVHAVVPRRPGQNKKETLDGIIVHGLSVTEVFFGKDIYRQIDADVYHMQEPTICGYHAQAAMPGKIHLATSMDPRELKDRITELKNATWSRRFKYPAQVFYENGPFVHRAVKRCKKVYVEAALLQEKARRLYNLPYTPDVLPKPIEIPTGPFIKDDTPLCTFVGRFDPRKRPEIFFELAKRMPDVNFIAIGKAHDDSYQNYLEKHYFHLPNLQVTGFVDPFKSSTVQDILARTWILVHPAAREGLCTAFQEASVNEAGILAYVDPGKYVSRFGELLESTNINDIESQLRNMLNNSNWRDKARAGREWNIAEHSTELSAQKHIAEYERLLHEHSAK